MYILCIRIYCMHIYIYICLYIEGTHGVSTNRVAANFVCFSGGTFWVLPLTYFHLPKSARAYLFPQSVEIHCFLQRPH